ncbi:MAG: polymorphic toxin type 50 domain-containing protein [Paracoccaceae bacterium]
MAVLQAELEDIKVELAVLQDTLEAVKEGALADGVIDDYEQSEIDELNAVIREAKNERDAIEAEIQEKAEAGAEDESLWDKVTDAAEDFFGGSSDDEDSGGTAKPEIAPSAGEGNSEDDDSDDYADPSFGNGVSDEEFEEQSNDEEPYADAGGESDWREGPPDAPDQEPQEPKEMLELFPDDGADLIGPGPAEPEDKSSFMKELLDKQMDLQNALLNATGPERDAILADLEAMNDEIKGEAELLAEKESLDRKAVPLADELMTLQTDLYIEFQNATGPDPNIPTPEQERILAEMNDVRADLGLEVMRIEKIHELGLDPSLEGSDLDEEILRSEYEEGSEFNNEGMTDEEFSGTGLHDEETSDYMELFEGETEMEELDDPDLIVAEMAQDHEKLLAMDELGPEALTERKAMIAKRYGLTGPDDIKAERKGGEIWGFRFPAEAANPILGEGTQYVDMFGDLLGKPEYDTQGLENELLDLAGEIVVATFCQLAEVALDIKDLAEAVIKYKKDPEGNVYPVILIAGIISVPYSRAGKRFFKIGGKLLDADKLAKMIKAKNFRGLGKIFDVFREAVIDQDALLKGFYKRSDVQRVIERVKHNGLEPKDLGLSKEQLLDVIGTGSKEEMDRAVKHLERSLDDTLAHPSDEVLKKLNDATTPSKVGGTAGTDAATKAVEPNLDDFSKRLSNKQGRHILGHKDFEPGNSFFLDKEDAQKVLDAFHNGSAKVIGYNKHGNPVIKYGGVNASITATAKSGSSYTDIFFVKGTKKVSIVPSTLRSVVTKAPSGAGRKGG